MLHSNFKRAALVLFLVAARSMPASAQVTRQIELVTDPDSKPQIFENVQQSFPPPTAYWIGVEAQPLDDAMRTALELADKHGLLVARVTENSPAAKAGLQAGDVLLQWCDKDKNCQSIKSVEHLVKLVQESAAKHPDQAITLEIRRRGKMELIEVKLAERPDGGQNFDIKTDDIAPDEHMRHQQSALLQQLKMLERQRDEAKKKLEEAGAKTSRSGPVDKNAVANQTKAEVQLKLLEAQTKQAEAQLKQFEVWTKAMSEHGFSIAGPNGANFDVLIPGPGLMTNPYNPILPLAHIKGVEWPEDLSVTITRKGNKPAEFVIERGEKKWQATSETINDLPRDIRALVETAEPQKTRMLRLFQTQGNEAPGRVELRLPEEARPPQMALPIAPPRVVIHATPQIQPPPVVQASQKQIEDLQKAIEQLRKQVEKIEKK